MALVRAAEVHDLLRFVDFPSDFQKLFTPTKEQLSVWKNWKTQYDGLKHEEACATFLRARGFDALASIVEVHGLRLPSPNRATIEQKLLFYADKRVKFDEVVSLDERFDDFCERYGKGKQSKESTIWYKEAKELEKELFPE
jgi:hypothetical protein